MQIYVSTNCLFNYRLEKTLLQYSQAKINKIELSSCPDIAKPDNICKLVLQYPFNYLVHNYFPPPLKPFVFNLASKNPEIAQRSLELAKKAVQLCKKIGSPFYSFHSGFLYDAEVSLEEKTKTFKPINKTLYRKETALKNFFKNLIILQKIAKQNKVWLLIENNVCPPVLKNKLLFFDEKDFLWIFSHKEIDQVGILLDTGHLKVSAKTYGFSMSTVIQKLKDKIVALHLHDNNALADLHGKIKAGSWIENIIKQLKNPNLILILEARLKNINEVLQQKKYLESLA